MVDPKDIDTLNSELENRLDDLFSENDIQLADAPGKEVKEHYPLAELKNLILSIDWEITDEVLDNLLQQVKDLQLTYKHDKIVSTFLQILNSLTTYIKTHRAKAHPKTFKILNSVFTSLDKVVLSGDMPEPSKKKILRAEMNRYKELRTQIAKSKAAARRKVNAQPVPVEPPKKREPKEEPVHDLYEASVKTGGKPAEELPIRLENPSRDGNQNLLMEPAIESSQPPDVVDLTPSKEPPVEMHAAAADPAGKDRSESVLTLVEDAEPADDGAAGVVPGADHGRPPQTELVSLTAAVEEIKRYIHAEVAALKEEIQALRELR